MHFSTGGRPELCWPRVLLLVAVIAAVVLVPIQTALAVCVAAPLSDGGFEAQRSPRVSAPWIAEGRAGIDLRRGFSRSGSNNAWARSDSGWNAIRQSVRLQAGTVYTLTGWVRTSPNVRSGYFGFRAFNQRPVAEIRFGSLAGYRELRVSFRPARTGTRHVFTGFWAPGQDAWIQIDDMRLTFPCNDVVLNPAPG